MATRQISFALIPSLDAQVALVKVIVVASFVIEGAVGHMEATARENPVAVVLLTNLWRQLVTDLVDNWLIRVVIANV